MLKSLYISNYALIDELNISWEKGMTVMTGETGAGKSIIIGALSLIIGQRADTKAIKTDSEKCIIEAEFDVSEYKHLEKFFEDNELDYDPVNCIIRREITNTGKSRAFINDSPAGLNVVKDLSSQLIDIHSQHENLLISNENYQLEIVDAIADNSIKISEYQHLYKEWNALKIQLKSLKNEIERQTKEIDFIQFQYNQLSGANLKENEQDELELELEVLTHAEEIKTELIKSSDLLNSDNAAIPLLKEATNSINKVKLYLLKGEEWYNRLQSAYIEIKDLSQEIFINAEKVEYNPERLNDVEGRLSEIYSLQKKYKVDTVNALIDLKEEYEQQLNRIESYDDDLKELTEQLNKTQNQLNLASEELTNSRKAVFNYIESYLVEQLNKLGIPHAQVQIEITEMADFQLSGKDAVQFMFSANKNRALQPVQLIASGGEISRLMLSIKSLVVKKQNLPTIIFDEIDTGVSGEIAQRMGEIMRKMSDNMQVICITHLPQIAAKGNTHFKVYKDDSNIQTSTHISLLTSEQRIEEIAEMLSGKNPSQAARQNAIELLGSGY
jgi:DNA repair protein RecN (Recombination protein N)